jgi:hypothetical protein
MKRYTRVLYPLEFRQTFGLQPELKLIHICFIQVRPAGQYSIVRKLIPHRLQDDNARRRILSNRVL